MKTFEQYLNIDGGRGKTNDQGDFVMYDKRKNKFYIKDRNFTTISGPYDSEKEANSDIERIQKRGIKLKKFIQYINENENINEVEKYNRKYGWYVPQSVNISSLGAIAKNFL